MQDRGYSNLCDVSKKIISSCVVLSMILASFVVMTNNVVASGGTDVITTYSYNGSFNQTTTFFDEDSVFVNVTVDNITGDPDGSRYSIKAFNTNTNEWVFVPVSDNDTNPPFENNTPNDGVYWGFFNVSSSTPSQNATPGPGGNNSVLQVSVGDIINISEDSFSELDNDSEIAYVIITITSSGGGGNNPPNQPGNEQPGNETTDVPVNTNLSWNCSDPDGDPLTFDVYFGNSTNPPQVESNTSNMSYNPPGDLEYNTTYYWYVVAWDNNNASSYSSQWWFTTEGQGGGGNNPPDTPTQEVPPNGTGNVSLNTNLSWNCSDPDGDPLTYDIYCGNTSPPPKVWENYTSTSYYYNLTYNTTYYWKIVAWDNHNASTSGPIWSFTTQAEDGGPGNESGNGTIHGFVVDSYNNSIPNATVMLNRTDQPQPPQTVFTNDTGYYIFYNNVTAGDYEMEVFKEGYMSNNRTIGTIYANETRWENFTLDNGEGPGGGSIYLDEWQSSISPAYIMNNTEKNLTFMIKMHAGPDTRLNNITISLPEGFRYEGNNGTNLQDTSNFTVVNTDDMVRWQKTNNEGFFFSENTYCWFNVSTNASLGPHNFSVSISYGTNNSDMFIKRVFTTVPYYMYGSVKDSERQPVAGANVSVTVCSYGEGYTYIGVFWNSTDENGTYNITNLPVSVNVSNINLSGPMGPGSEDEDGLFYTLSAQKNSEINPNCAIGISTSLPSLPITEVVRFLQNVEIYLKPALTFRVNVTGNTYIWNETNQSVDIVYGLKNFSIMVKDRKLGYPVKEYNTMSNERIFSVPRDRNYSFTIFADQSFPVSIRFNNVYSTCINNGSLNQSGVTTSYVSYNGSYLINVSVDVASTTRHLTGVFNNVTNPIDMRVVAYTMEDQDMVFENWAMPYNLGNETGDGPDDQYYLSNRTYSIYLPATNATSYLLLRAYAKNASGYYMGSAFITAQNQVLSSDTVNFDMLPLIQGGTNRTITANNVSDQWNDTIIVNTTAVLFRLVDSNGDLLSSENPFVEVTREINGREYKQMIDGQNGMFNISLVEGESLNELTIYSQQYAPISTPVSAGVLNGSTNTSTIRCSNGVCNITMRRFGDFDPFGENASLRIRMLGSNETCNVPNPPDFCDVCGGGPGDENDSGVMDENEFSPFNAILKGSINLMIMTNTSQGWIYVYYINVDLLASGPPDAAFSTESQDTEGGLAKAWQFGSQGPDIYDYVLIGIPLSDELVNKTVKVEIPLLYDNEFNVIWNASAGDTVDTIRNNSALNTTYGDYLNTPYEAYLNGTGVICSTTDSTLSTSLAYKDVVNHTIWIKIPHFSGVGPQITGVEPNPPANFTATANSTSVIYLTWTKPLKADYTRIQRKTGSYPTNISDGDNVYNGTGTSCSDTGLSEGTTYYYAAWSWNQTNGYWSVNSSTAYATTKSTPYQTGASPINGATAVDLTPPLHVICSENDTGDTLTAYWYSNSSGSWVLFAINTSVSNGTNITQTNSNFSGYSTTYYWSVNLTDGSNWCNQTYHFTTRSQYVPNAPSGFTATANGRFQITLSWTNDGEADSTRIEYSLTSDDTWNVGDHNLLYNESAESISHTGLDPGTTVYYKAWSWNETDSVWSSASTTSATTASNNVPSQSNPNPSDGAADIDVSLSQLIINLSDTDGDTMNWTIETSPDVGNASDNNASNGTINCSISGLQYSTNYTWYVNVTDGYNNSNATYVFTTRSQYIPTPPTSFTATAASSSKITLTWTKGNHSDYTRIQRKTGNYPTNISDGTNVYNGTGTSCSDTGLTASTKYYYRAWSYNATDKTWSTSNASNTATTKSASTGGYSPPGGQQEEEQQQEEEETQPTNTSSSQTTINEINETFNIELNEPFYANDTDGDGTIDTFTDPNNKLTLVNTTTINNSIAFLVSTDDDEIPEFFWNPTDDTITKITHSTATITSTSIDTQNETVTITIAINKSNWVYIGIVDEYPEYSVTVKTSDGRTIPSDKIWRKNNKIYVLDDPDTEYKFIYNYTILPPTFKPEPETTITTTSKPTITITYNENVTIVEATLNKKTITLTTYNNKTFNYTPTNNLTNGEYTLKITVKDNKNNTRTDTAKYTINIKTSEKTTKTPTKETPWIIIILATIITIWIIIGLLFKTGILYLEERKPPKK